MMSNGFLLASGVTSPVGRSEDALVVVVGAVVAGKDVVTCDKKWDAGQLFSVNKPKQPQP